MSWPIIFNSLTNPQPLSDFDVMFNAVAGVISIPSIASGTNAISLTPTTNSPALPAYVELCGARFRAVANSTGPVTASINGLSFLPVYHSDGVTQANVGDLVAGQQYIVTWSQSLNAGGGGFFLESPSIPNAASSWFAPGGRLTLNAGTPVMFSNVAGATGVNYSAYAHQFVPIYNGSIVQMVNFCSSLSNNNGLSLAMSGAANFPVNLPFDIFVTLVGAVPTLVAIAWSNSSTRATTLALFAGFLTNGGSATAQTGPGTSITLPVNQGTFLGTIFTSAQGTTQWIFGGSASGGVAGSFLLSNYYNAVLFTSQSTDTGVTYNYTSNTIRQARGSTGNAISGVSCSSERAMSIAVSAGVLTAAATPGANTVTGYGINSTTGFANFAHNQEQTGGTFNFRATISGFASVTGVFNLTRLEQGDGSSVNTLDPNSNDFIQASFWA